MNTEELMDLVVLRRKRLGLSRKSFGLLLGISEPSIVRYEAGATPSPSNQRLLEMSLDDDFMRKNLDEVGVILPLSQKQRATEELSKSIGASAIVSLSGLLDENTGFTEQNLSKVAQAMNYLAARCKKPYFTRVIKGCFIADQLHYEQTGVSLLGLKYAHAPHGPIIDGHENIRRYLENKQEISLADDGLGFVFETSDFDTEGDIFSKEEKKILDSAARYVDSFPSIELLSRDTHKLRCWADTPNGGLIPYRRGSDVYSLVEDRLYQPNARLREAIAQVPNAEPVDIDEFFSDLKKSDA